MRNSTRAGKMNHIPMADPDLELRGGGGGEGGRA